MTQTGHLLTGAAVGILSLPGRYTKWQKIAHVVVFACLAILPDLPIPHWGHDRYYFSHSIFVTAYLIASCLILLVSLPGTRTKIGGWPVIFGGFFAWLSHLLLDSFYNHGLGIAIFWPYSKARLVLPIPWLGISTTPAFPITAEKIRIFFFELVTFSPLCILAIILKRKRIGMPFRFGSNRTIEE